MKKINYICSLVYLLVVSFLICPSNAFAKRNNNTSIKKTVPNVCEHQDGSYSKNSLLVVLKPSVKSSNLKSRIAASSNPTLIKLRTSSNKVLELVSLFNKPDTQALSRINSTASKSKINKFFEALAKTNLARTYAINFSDIDDCGELQNLIDELAIDDSVEAIHLDRTYNLRGILDGNPNDPHFSNQWNLKRVNAPDAWVSNKLGANVRVGIIDNRLYTNHADINGVTNSLVQSSPLAPPQDLNSSHGTMVTSIVSATGDNNNSIIGVAPSAKINFYSCPNTNSQCVIQGLQNLVSQGSDVINFSFGFYLPISLKTAWQQDPEYILISNIIKVGNIPVVVASGNDNVDVRETGCEKVTSGTCQGSVFDAYSAIPGIISVSATDINNQKANSSNFGTSLSAPGASIPVIGVDPVSGVYNVYANFTGTSFSAPLVAGAIAILKSQSPWLSATGVKVLLEQTGSSLPDSSIGKLINIKAALDFLVDYSRNLFDNFNFVNLKENQIFKNPSSIRFEWTVPNKFNTNPISIRNDLFNLEIYNTITNQMIFSTILTSGLYSTPNFIELIGANLPKSGNYRIIVKAVSKYGFTRIISRNFQIVNEAEIINSLIIPLGGLDFNKIGAKEKYLFSPLTQTSFALTPDGKLWSKFQIGPGAQELLMTLDPSFYQDLTKFNSLKNLTPKQVYDAHGLNLRVFNNDVSFNKYGKYEKWFRGKLTATTEAWYTFEPNGNIIDDASKIVILKTNPSFYTNINLILQTPLTDADLIKVHNYLATSTGNTSFNFSGQGFEKWFRGRFGAGLSTTIWSYITPDGSVFYTVSNLPATSVPILKLDQKYFTDPSIFDLITDNSDQFFWKSNKADLKLSRYSANHGFNWSGIHKEKWFVGAKKAKETSVPQYYILPNGKLYRYKGGGKASMVVNDVLVAELNTSYYQNPETLFHTSR